MSMDNNLENYNIPLEFIDNVLESDKHSDIRDMLLAAGEQLFENKELDEDDLKAYISQIRNARFVILPNDWIIYIYHNFNDANVLAMKEDAIKNFPSADYWEKVVDKTSILGESKSKTAGGTLLFSTYLDNPGYVFDIERGFYTREENNEIWPKPEQFNFDTYDD